MVANDASGEPVDRARVSLDAPPGATGVTTDADGDITGFTVAGEGNWSVDASSGEVTFSPATGFTGTPTPITYTVADQAATPNRSGPITVTLVDDAAPVAGNDTGSFTGAAVVVDVLANDGGPAGLTEPLDRTTITLAGSGGPGQPLDAPGEGQWTVDTGTGRITFTPVPGFVGKPSVVTYTVADTSGNVSNAASIDLADDAAPQPIDDLPTNVPPGPLEIDVTANDQAGGPVDPTTVVFTGPLPPGGTLTNGGRTLTVTGEGTWTVNSTNGRVTFTPLPGIGNDPTPVTYQVTDADGNAGTATVGVDYAPVASNDNASPGATSTAPVDVNVLANDTTGDAPVAATLMLLDAGGSPVTSVVVPGQGTWSVQPGGVVRFLPEATFAGDPTPVNYVVEDADGNRSNPAQVFIDYNPVPDPDAVNDSAVIAAAGPGSLNVTDNDAPQTGPRAIDRSRVSLVAPVGATGALIDPEGDTVAFSVPGEGDWSVDAAGVVTFAPLPAFTTDPTPIQYRVFDRSTPAPLPSNFAVITLDYAPGAVDDSADFTGSDVTFTPATNDTTGDTVVASTVRLLDAASQPVTTLTEVGVGTWTVDTATGSVTFAPVSGFTGTPASVNYVIEDSEGNTDTATLTLVDRTPPALRDDSGSFAGLAVDVSVLTNDGNGEPLDPATITLAGATGPGASVVRSGEGTWSVDVGTGTVRFTPDGTFTGTPTPITYTVSDTAGNTATAPATITLTDDAPPVGQPDSEPFSGGPVTVDVLANDAAGEPVDPASVQLVGTANPGEPLNVPGEGIWSVGPASGVLTFSPAPGFTGTPTPQAYTVADLAGNRSAPVAVTLTDATPPSLSDDRADFTGSSVTIPVLANDAAGEPVDPGRVSLVVPPAGIAVTSDADGDVVGYEIPGEGAWTVTPTGELVFVPAPGFTGTPSPAEYTVTDASGNRATTPATVRLDDLSAPNGVADSGVFDGSAITLDVLANDAGGEPVDPASVQLVGTSAPGEPLRVPGEGSWTVDPATGALTFTPEPGFTGTPTPQAYTVADAEGNRSSPVDVTLADGSAPILGDDAADFGGGPVTLDVLGNDGEAMDPTTREPRAARRRHRHRHGP